ncbi:MAG: hypothetical protein HDT47_05060 [Ruminococcaceae bacterium]|nr:hypothetical protein [Oscillospiraceae bacterium]
MKKILVGAAIIAATVCGCKVDSLNETIQQQHSITIGEYVISDSQPMWEWVTDTPITDASEELLKEKYGRDFVCSYFLYPQEWSLCIEFKAAPADDPQTEFSYRPSGSGALAYDNYISMMYMDEISDWLYEGVDIPEIGEDGLIVYPTGSLTEQEAVSKIFNDTQREDGKSYCQHSFSIILITDTAGATKIASRSEEIIKSINERLGCVFMLYVGTESFYDLSRTVGAYGGVCLGSKIDYDELFYSYDCRRETTFKTTGKASEMINE